MSATRAQRAGAYEATMLKYPELRGAGAEVWFAATKARAFYRRTLRAIVKGATTIVITRDVITARDVK